jgi:hypothetical protein
MLPGQLRCSVIIVQQTVIDRVARGSRGVSQPQPVHHLESVFFDGLDAAPEIPGNSLVGISERDTYQHLPLARCHIASLPLGGLRDRRYVLAYGSQRRQFRLIIFRSLGADRAKQQLEWRIFEDVAVNTRRHCGTHALLASMTGEQQHPHTRAVAPQLA